MLDNPGVTPPALPPLSPSSQTPLLPPRSGPLPELPVSSGGGLDSDLQMALELSKRQQEEDDKRRKEVEDREKREEEELQKILALSMTEK